MARARMMGWTGLLMYPKRFYYDLAAPLTFEAGDRIRFTCTWMNTTAETLAFPHEMCIFSANTLTDTDLTCVNGQWMGKVDIQN